MAKGTKFNRQDAFDIGRLQKCPPKGQNRVFKTAAVVTHAAAYSQLTTVEQRCCMYALPCHAPVPNARPKLLRKVAQAIFSNLSLKKSGFFQKNDLKIFVFDDLVAKIRLSVE